MNALLVLLFLVLAACGSGGGDSAAPAQRSPDPGFVAPQACASSPLLGPTWNASGNTIVFNPACEFTHSTCANTWRIEGHTDNTFPAPGQLVQLHLVAQAGPFGPTCFRPENTPYTCTVRRYFDGGLNKWVLNFACDKGFATTSYLGGT